MDLELQDEHLELRAAAIGVLDRFAPLSLARGYLEGNGDAGRLWSELAELGWLGVGLEQDDPFGVPGLCVLAEQIGRHAAPTTLVDTACAARAANATETDWAARLIAGDPPLALAVLEPANAWTSPPATSARRDDGGAVISGEKTGVHHAASVGLLGVLVELDGSPALALVDPASDGVSVAALDGLDPSCAACHVAFNNARVRSSDVFTGPAAAHALDHALAVAAVATTAEGLGAASGALELAIGYSLEREQYGRKIGAFQALQHQIADLYVLRETAWAAVLYAAAALEERTADSEAAVAVAKAHGAVATKAVVEGALQVFGGVGFTREHDLHLLYRRALECAERFGGAVEHERRVAAVLLSREPAFT